MSVVAPKKFRILVVDDQAIVRRCICIMLAHDGHEVETASSGGKAMALFERNKFDLVLTDYVMPEMRGDELVAAIKARAPKQPIVMVTADAEKLRESDRVPAGVDFLIGKPFSLEKLREAIATVLPEKCLAE
jgi:CheY-like chemotaxis protein